MSESWKSFLLLIFLCLIVQAFFAMLEMACVSFNKVRLQYYVSKGSKRAIWLARLLNRPGELFGTTLIGVNAALQLGSECARRFYVSIDLSPDWAPLSQVILVLLFAEIAPLLAARRYAEHTAMLGIPLLYFTSIVLRPVIWFFEKLCQILHKIVGTSKGGGLYLTREEVQKILEEREESPLQSEKQEFNTITSNIFSLRGKTAKDLMLPLKSVQMLPSFCTVGEMKSLLSSYYTPFLPLYHGVAQNIIAIAYPRDLLRLSDNAKIKEHCRPPWFITETSSILEILKQFRRNNQSVAVVLGEKGIATGILTLDEIVDEVFGEVDTWMSFEDIVPFSHHIIVDRTFPGEMKIDDFNRQFRVNLEARGVETLEDLVDKILGHSAGKGESVKIDQFELTVEEAPLIGQKLISVRTIG